MTDDFCIIGQDDHGRKVIALEASAFQRFLNFLHLSSRETSPEKAPNTRILTIKQFANELGVHESTIRTKVGGVLSAACIQGAKGGAIRIDAEHAIQLLKQTKTELESEIELPSGMARTQSTGKRMRTRITQKGRTTTLPSNRVKQTG